MRTGFIGTGAITRAIVTGMTKFDVDFAHIALSPRNADTAARLAALDGRIEVSASNQDVLDSSDVIFLAVVPQIAPDVLGELRFDKRHHVISLMAGISIARVRELVGEVKTIVRAVPLPAVAEGMGTTALCPPDDIARTVFAALGRAVEVSSEHEFDALSAITATMASFYALLEEQASWLVKQGLSYDAARAFLSGYHEGLAHDAAHGTQPFSQMIGESCTTGGINEQLYDELSGRGTFSHYSEALDRIMQRIQGRS